MGVNLGTTIWLNAAAWLSILGNGLLVVTGGAVRLTGSGLGCPTWPHCNPGSFTPHGALTYHSAIEFGNRLLTFALAAIAIFTFVAAWQSGRKQLRVLALILGLAIPAQAVIGGITVLTDLNPWLVALHLLASMGLVSLGVVFLDKVNHPKASSSGHLRPLAWAIYLSGWAVLYIGTIVTGAGPHAGSADVPRNGLDPLQWSQLHADFVFLHIGLTLGLLLLLLASHAPKPALVAVTTLFVVQLLQGAIGYVQYFTNLPIVLVATHMLGAALIAGFMTQVLVVMRRTPMTLTRQVTNKPSA
ncbi:MAG TPA: COX15/CtaA family protein [Marmoricola sp.]|nr:COX15/CtaA family protein [Marmoricola sp.]